MATILTAGDVAIVGKRGQGSDPGSSGNPNNDDSFAFVLLRSIDAGTVINFTDKEWAGGAGGGLTTNLEGTFTYTASSAVAAGTVVTLRFDGNTSAFPNGMSFPSAGGDQIIAFQGSLSSPTILDVFQDVGAFQASGTGVDDNFNRNTEVPPGIVVGQTAVAVGQPVNSPGYDNASNWTYTGVTSGSKADLQAAIHNLNNWVSSTDHTTITFPTSFNVGAPPSPAEINLRGNGVDIVDGDATPSYADSTQFGGTAVAGGFIEKTFTIFNQGGTALNVGQITITGANAGDFSISASPSASVAGNGSTTFTVRFDPSSGGFKTASISIANGDANENPYNFDVSGSGIASAPTPLGAGDIAFVGFNGDFSTTTFAFVLLKPIVAGTVIKFTDAGWNGAALGTNEFAAQWVAPTDIPFGTVVQFNESDLGPNFQTTSDGGYFTGGRFHLESGGDQIFAYTGSPTAPTFLGGLHTDSSAWDTSFGGGSGSSLLPPGLTDGVNAISFGNGPVNFYSGVYSGSTTGDQAALLAKINNEANWTGSANPQTLPSGNFGGGGSAPEIDVQYQVGGVAIADGSTTPVATDGTQFDAQDVTGDSQSHTFVIRNLGDQTLNLGQVTVTGANASDFTFTLGSTTVGASQQTTLTVTFDPSAAGARTATINIASNDANEASYDFAVRGLGRDPAQTLSAGDVAFAGYDASLNQFAFVLMTDVEAGTSIKFTNGGWTGSTYRQGDGAVEWTAATGLSAGTVIVYDGALPNGGPDFAPADTGYFTAVDGFNPQIAGDQIIAYQGSASAGGAGLVNLAALYYDKSTFDTTYTDTIGSSLLPAGLVDGQTAISFGKPDGVSAFGSGVYTGPTNLPFAQQLAALNNEANWTGSDFGVTFPSGPIGVNGPPVANDDAVSTDEATALAGDVLADNGSGADTDVDGPALEVAEVNGSAAGVGTEITLASGALLTLNANGTFDYDPNGAFDSLPGAGSGAQNLTATDSFTYTLVGGGSATVTITVSGQDSDGDVLQGSGLSDTLDGGVGADTLIGGAGQDSMTGGLGDDLFLVGRATDLVVEAVGGGTDTVATSASYELADGVEVETLKTTKAGGLDPIALTGNGFDQTILGNAGNNQIDGRGGADEMRGGAGDDVYFVDDAGDVVSEFSGGGADVVAARADYRLEAGVHVELLRTTANGGTAAIDLAGNELANIINGNAAANKLSGGRGADTMKGLDGDDLLNGGSGRDRLYGGEGEDDFVFTATPAAPNSDLVMDFTAGADGLLLGAAAFGLAAGALDPNAFRLGSAAADASDRIIYHKATGALFFDQDGSGGAFAKVQFATIVTEAALSAADFTVI